MEQGLLFEDESEDSGEAVVERVSENGFKAGWLGHSRESCPESQTRRRRTWLRHWAYGKAAQERYQVMYLQKVCEDASHARIRKVG